MAVQPATRAPFSVLITGANRGIGLEFVKQFTSRNPKPSTIIATTRSAGSHGSKELEDIAAKDPTVKVDCLSIDPSASICHVTHASVHAVRNLIANGTVLARRKYLIPPL